MSISYYRDRPEPEPFGNLIDRYLVAAHLEGTRRLLHSTSQTLWHPTLRAERS